MIDGNEYGGREGTVGCADAEIGSMFMKEDQEKSNKEQQKKRFKR